MKKLHPQWTAGKSVHAWISARSGGVSVGPYESLNVAAHVGDDASHVEQNRKLLQKQGELPREPFWLTQVHGTLVVRLEDERNDQFAPNADGCVTSLKNHPLVIMTADCLPILACDQDQTVVGAFHAGWKGLAAGILENAVAAMEKPAEDLIFWIGPGIGKNDYEVGPEVYEAFVVGHPQIKSCFTANGPGKWKFDLASAASEILSELGVGQIFQSPWTTGEQDLFFSHRRQNPCGRMASVIWLS